MQQHRNLAIPDTLADVCHPDRLALVVYDMQVGVVGQLADGPQVTERVRRVLEAARQAAVRGVLHQVHDAADRADGDLPAAHGDGLAAQAASRGDRLAVSPPLPRL